MAKKKQTRTEIMGLAAEPAELIKRRAALLKCLQAEASKSTGAVQQVLRKMHQLIGSTEPDAPYQESLFGEVAESFKRLLKSTETSKKPVEIPQSISEANQFVLDHATNLRERMEKAGIELPVEKKMAMEKTAVVVKGIKDQMAKAPSQNSAEMLGNADAPLAGEVPQPEKIPEALKDWVNPALGHIGNK